MAITFVGGTGAGRAGSTSTASQSITGLTGGSDSAPIEGDLVLVVVATATQARNPACAISGWSTIGTQLNVTSTTYDTSLQVSYKFMGSTPDTSITIPSTGDIADGQSRRVLVFRGVDPTTPLDVAAVSATGTGTTRFDAAAITPTTPGAFIAVFGGGSASASTTALGTPSGLSGWGAYNGADTNDGSAGGGYYGSWTSGAYDPAAPTTGGSVNAANSWAAWTIALRPAPTPIPIDIDTAGALTLAGQTADFSLTDLGGDAWAVGAWASGAWAAGAWDVAPSGSDLTLDIDTAGALTVSGQSLTLATSLATANGSLTLAGQSVLSSVNVALSNGSLTLSGQTLDTDLSAGLGLAIDTAGALTLAGQTVATDLTLDLFASIEAGALSIAGQSLTAATSIALGNGSLTVAGQTVDTALTLDLFVGIDAGALTLAGQSLTAATNVALTSGSLTLSGQDVTPSLSGLYAWEPGAWANGAWAANSWRGMAGGSLGVSVDAGALTISGQTITTDLTLDLFASIENGSLTITGQSVTTAIDVALSHGSLTLDGQTVNATAGNNLAVEIDTAGALTVSGETVNTGLTLDLFVGIDAGALTIDGQTVTTDLTLDLFATIEAGALTINGQDVTPSLTVDQAWASGAWAFGAWATNSWRGMVGPDSLTLDIDTAGALAIAGQATKFAWSVPWTEGQLTLTGQSLAANLNVGLANGSLTISGQTVDIDLTADLSLSIDAGALTLTGQTATINLGDDISVDIDAGALTLAGQSLTAATNVALSNGSLTIDGQTVDAALISDLEVTIEAGNLTISGESVSISGIEAPRDPMIGGGGPTRDDRKKFKKWLERKPYQPIDVEIEAGTLSISGQQVGVNLTDYRKPFTVSDDIKRPLLRLPQKRKSVAVSVDIDKLIAEELRYAEELEAQKRKKRRKQDEEILLLM